MPPTTTDAPSPRSDPSPARLVRAFLDRHGLRPRKSLGQHFLIDAGALRRIADAGELTAADLVVEVGPGPGTLTRELLARAGSVIAVEKDERAAEGLRDGYAGESRLRVVTADMLATDPGELTGGAAYSVVANLPYYAASPILRRFLEASHRPERLVVLLQREVAESAAAKPDGMSIFSVAVQVYAAARIVGHVKAGSFTPPPKVESSIVRLDPYPRPRGFAHGEADAFFEIVRAGFGTRRKQLANALTHGLAEDRGRIVAALNSAGVDPRRRAETLTIDEWGALHRAIQETRAHAA